MTRPFTRQFSFSGYDWSVKDSREQRTGPGNNYFSASSSNVWVAEDGRLHLKINHRDGRWYCAELVSQRSFGYGTYRVFLDSAADNLNANVVLGLFTWNDDGPYAHRELDVELSRWSDADDTNNAQFVVQPWDQPGHRVRYRIQTEVTNSTHSFTWRSNRADFVSYVGSYALPPAMNTAIAQWSFSTNGAPQAGGENFRINFWLCNTNGTTDGLDEEIVISRFVFVPEQIPQPIWTDARWSANGQFAALSKCEPQLTYQVKASTNMISWNTMATFTATNGTMSFLETNSINVPCRFYQLAVPQQ